MLAARSHRGMTIDLLRPLMEAGLVKREGKRKYGRYVLA